MRMNKPEIEVVDFEVSDIVTTSYDENYSHINGQFIVFYKDDNRKLFYTDGSAVMWTPADDIYKTFRSLGTGVAEGVYYVENGTWTWKYAIPSDFSPK